MAVLDVTCLRSSHDILELVKYRNKNQHRRSAWWTTLRALQRCLTRLIDDVNTGARARVHDRCVFMATRLLPEAHR